MIGIVEAWQEYGGPPLLEVKSKHGKEILIPFAKSICVGTRPTGVSTKRTSRTNKPD